MKFKTEKTTFEDCKPGAEKHQKQIKAAWNHPRRINGRSCSFKQWHPSLAWFAGLIVRLSLV